MSNPPKHRKLVIKLLLLTVASAAFGFALVPFYESFCKAFGLNGKTSAMVVDTKEVVKTGVDMSRPIKVQFTSTLMPGLPWRIRPLETEITVHPGEVRTTRFVVFNNSNKAVTGQAVPSITPGQAAKDFQKIECFCFQQQTMKPGETREMPLTFVISPTMDKDIAELTLAYAFFPAPTNTTTPTGGLK